ncbi:MAG: glycosyltransferase [Candidatus Thermoplasmatota archaeon]|nr:glycosyltransferase [Candidatus Thermoplasmatota archaeon]
MNILQLTNFFKPSWEAGGPPRSVYELSKQLVRKGHDVTVYTTDGFKRRLNVTKNRKVDVDGIKTYYFSNISLFLAKKFVTPIPYQLPLKISEEIKKFDVIHMHEYRTIPNLVVAHYAKKNDIPYVLQPRASTQRIAREFLKKIYDSSGGYKLLKNAKKIVLSSKNEYKLAKPILDYCGIDEPSIEYLPNGINLEEYQSAPSENEFRSIFSIPDNAKLILFLGRLHHRKGLDILVKAFKELLIEMKDIALIIVGPDDGYLLSLKRLIGEEKLHNNVILTGPLYGKQKISAYAAATVFVLPSKDEQESFGNVVLEASACGLPSVVTNVCGVTEWMENIITIEPTVESIKRGIKEGLKNKEIGTKAMAEVRIKFDVEAIAEKYIEIYRSIKNMG